ncbi:Transmembrane domain-containing protein [Spironucleus salmonicida]|uniref:Transmembrane domain-containing protein n=1 Tax=Spironucleus salmonicida TaxID=348837 RepID=V6LB85_9EUKA|nr:Transmembrane domain-containing protein [Spironucleus salmonicida]|eukprot:EST41657.1 Transmembrane domain-containing protein [Spironucleus salmonicida]
MTASSTNQQFEISLSSTIVSNLVVAIIVMLIFPLIRYFFPSIYSPLHYLPHKNTGPIGEIFWYIDMFKQPLSVFAQRGNLTLIFALFQNLLLLLFTFIALISALFLIPAYYTGTDQQFNSHYLTIWSKMSLQHLEEGSILVLVSIISCVLITLSVLFFYQQFVLVYIHFRQKTFKRVIPQNFVVMLSNLPPDVDKYDELKTMIDPISQGVMKILPIPPNSRQLTLKANKLKSISRKIIQMKYHQQKLSSQILEAKARYHLQKSSDKGQFKKETLKLIAKFNNYGKDILKEILKQKKIKKDITIDLHKLGIKADYFQVDGVYPPHLPQQIEECFIVLRRNQEPMQNAFQIEKYLNTQQKRQIKQLYLYSSDNKVEKKQKIGSYAFLICKSQQIAAEKYTTLIDTDAKRPEASIAPAVSDINWTNLSISTKSRKYRMFGFILALLVLFVVYFFVQALIMRELQKISDDWVLAIYSGICRFNCPTLTIQTLQSQVLGICGICHKVSTMLVTFLPTIVNALLMSLLPILLSFTIDILGLASKQDANELMYNILFLFLILIQGIVQIVLPTAIQPETGSFNIDQVVTFSISQFFTQLGQNLPNQTFVFINYIISKYFLFPVIGLFNFPVVIQNIIYRIVSKNALELVENLKKSTFNYPKQLAYITHMFVVGFIFAIIAPFTNIIVLFTFIMMVITDRYHVLYIAGPSPSTELTPQSTLIKSVSSNIFIGLIFMQISTFAFLLQYQGTIYLLGLIVIAVCFAGSVAYKIQFDKRYKRSLIELARGNYIDKSSLTINPASNYNGYEDNTENIKGQSRLEKTAENKNTKQNFFDKILSTFYIDLTDLPVSYTEYQSLTQISDQSVVLDTSTNKDVISNYTLNDQDVDNIAQAYSHPSIGYSIGNQLKLD